MKMKAQRRKSIKFVVATDVHLGHKQSHHVRSGDSFAAFEEVLSIATDEHADFLLLGGDLFDQVNPSQKTIYKCLDILQKYVQGPPKQDLRARYSNHPDYKINFQNNHMNIKLPVFTIHGNHDYPSNDFGKLSICDLLHVSNYANYFGKHTDLEKVVVQPFIIEKPGLKMKVAIYGLGYIKDTVLNEMFQNDKVTFQKLQNPNEYFCIFIFHQNRYKKGLRAGAPALKCISSRHIPDWMDLTIWGHEHEAISKIEVEDDRKIFQPGSTVITSFIEAESYPKQCLMVEIFEEGEVDLTPIPLKKSYRPMVCRNIQISQAQKKHKASSEKQFDLFAHLDNQIASLISEIEGEFPGRKPIIRLKVQRSDQQISRCRILEVKYSEKVANPESIMSFWKRKNPFVKEEKVKSMEGVASRAEYVGYDHRQIADQILHIYIQQHKNKTVYFDPKLLYQFHHASIAQSAEDPEGTQNQLVVLMTKDIDRQAEPMEKEIKALIDNITKDLEQPALKLAKDYIKYFPLNVPNPPPQTYDQPHHHIKYKRAWEQQKQLLLLKQNQIKNIKVKKNYGDNFKLENPFSAKFDPNFMELESNHHENNAKKPFVSNQKFHNQDYQDLLEFKIPDKPQKMQHQPSNVKEEKGFSKRSTHFSGHLASSGESDEQDCCKRAEKTQFDEIGIKRNFEGANKIIKEKNAKVLKKQGNVQKKKLEPKKAEKKTKDKGKGRMKSQSDSDYE